MKKASYVLIMLSLLFSTFAFNPPQQAHALASIYSKGTFIQPDITKNWTVTDWEEELGYLKESGNELVILQWTGDSKHMTTIYPTLMTGFTKDSTYSGDQVENLLTAADTLGMQVWLGMNDNSDWYQYHATNKPWLDTLFGYSKQFVTELMNKYSTHTSLTGFYFNNEMENCNYRDSTSIRNLADVFSGLATHVHGYSSKTLAVAPALWPESWCGAGETFETNSADWEQTWDGILNMALIDYVLVQDGLGGSFHTNSEIVSWYSFIKSVIDGHPGTHLWADVETFRVVQPNPWKAEPMPIQDVVDHMVQVNPYVENIVTFSYDHYQSPKVIGTSYYHQTYKNYYTTGLVEQSSPTNPTGLNSTRQGTDKILLSWIGSTDNVGAMYSIYRDGVKAGVSYTTKFQDTGLTPGKVYSYQVQAFDAAGNISSLSAAINVMTAPATEVLSRGKSYTASVPANSSYPDTGGAELTNGNYAPADYQNTAWQGRSSNQPSTYSYTLDLGATKTFDAVSINFYQDIPSGIILPDSVEIQVSLDGSSYSSLGNASMPYLTRDKATVPFSLLTETSQNARYVKVIVNANDSSTETWVFSDEIIVEKYDTQRYRLVNIALNKPYSSTAAANASYPDTGGTELTDGVMGTSSFSNSAWQGRLDLSSYSFTIDLGLAQSINQFDATFLRDDASTLVLPTMVEYSTSMNNSTFVTQGTVLQPDSSNLSTTAYRLGLIAPATGRYVKVTVYSPEPGWSFIDEVKVQAAQKTNLAAQKTYTASIAAHAFYPDTIGTELTDGVMGTSSYLNTAWQGREDTASYSFTVDLGSSQSFNEFETTFLRDDTSVIVLPTTVQYSVSSDNVTFVSKGSVSQPASVNGTISNYVLTMASPVEARYVRVTVNSANGWSFVDEIRVQQFQRINAAANRSYTASVAASSSYPDTGGTELTDGVTGNSSYQNSAWQGRDNVASYSIIVDLALIKRVSGFAATFLRDDGSSIVLPTTVEYALSNDNSTFVSKGIVSTPSSANLSVVKYPLDLSSSEFARYVRLTVSSPTGWSFMDEVKVFE